MKIFLNLSIEEDPMFSKSCEYGIRAVIFIATRSQEGERVKVRDIASGIDSPVAFTAKIMGTLVREGIVESLTGPYGGFFISPSHQRKIAMSQIVEAIDGNSIFEGCSLGLKECNASHPCPVHDQLIKVRTELRKMLDSITVFQLAQTYKSGKTILMR